MDRQFSLIHLTVGSCPPPKLVYAAQNAGFDFVSFRGIPARGRAFPTALSGAAAFSFADSPTLLRDTKAALHNSGMKINDIENARIFDGVVAKEYRRDLEAAAELGCTNILTNVWNSDMNEALDAFCVLCEIASEYGQTVHIEFVTWSALRGLKDTLAFLNRSGMQNVGIVVDSLHFYRSHVTLSELSAIPSNYLAYMHLCDAEAAIPSDPVELARTAVTKRMIPGEGAIDILGIARMMPPSTVYGMEVPNPEKISALGVNEYLRELLTKTKQYMSNL